MEAALPAGGARGLAGAGSAPAFRPTGTQDLAPSGAAAKAKANLAALGVLRDLQSERRHATAHEQAVLARWSGWGSLPGVFDADNVQWAEVRAELRATLDDREWRAAQRNTLNAHYTPLPFAQAVWATARRVGFAGGRVLEPGCGTGVFLGAAPEDLDLELVGVELDPVTAGIAQALYPHATIRREGFQDTGYPEAWFDLAVGNVPFAKVALADPVHNRGGHSIHNHFLLKSLHLTRPGGLVACFTSRFTLDAQSPAARREMAGLADLVGAVRLPEGAFRAVAGTDVVIDLVVLRRREPDRPPGGLDFERAVEVATQDGSVTVNQVFAARPAWVLGDLSSVNGQYGEHDLTVRARPGASVVDQLTAALDEVVVGALEAGLVVTRRPAPPPPPPPSAGQSTSVKTQPWHKEGSLMATGAGFARVVDGQPQSFQPSPANGAGELRALIALRDTVFELLEAQSRTWDDDAFEPTRQRLNRLYDNYARRFGPLNRFTLARTGRVDPETGEQRHRKVFPRMGGFRHDPDLYAVLALEHFDPDTATATKAGIFERRVVTPRQPRLGAESAQDALSICLDTHGRPDLHQIARLLGVDPATARTALGELVYDDPATGSVVAAAAYLSGDVRAKLAEARTAAERDERFAPNVAALERVHPVDLTPGEIDARLGATWIEADDVAAFVREVLACESVVVEHVALMATWSLSAGGGERSTVAMTSEWGTARMDALHLVEALCNQRAVTIYDELPDGRRVQNVAETLTAREKAEALSDRFAAWVWEDPERADRLARVYNERFNSVVVPVHDGSHLSFPGLSSEFRPHRHQRDAVWRIVCEPTAGLFHAVGAGKTAVMAMAAMEQRRLGLVSKPAVVVPNHMLEQFASEFLQLYPQARVLVADKDDVSAPARKGFVARCAMGDWDAIVLTQSSFSRLPVSAESRLRFLEAKVDRYRAALTASKAGPGLSVKRLERALLRHEERHRALLAEHRKDDGVTFEATGIDYLYIDEAHAYKNLEFPTRIEGVSGAGSQRAEDLALKLDVLRAARGERVATFATATPIANSVAEMYVMLLYLAPGELARAGVEHFDAWAAAFGRTVTALELAPDGGSYRMHTRFARFANVPELLSMFRAVADVRTPDQLGLVVPSLVGGQPKTVVVPPSETLRTYVASLVQRAEVIRNRLVTPEEDNMLKVCGDGAKAALHLALVGEEPDPGGGKLAAAADEIARIHYRSAANRYLTPTGEPSPRPGALQLVFCDLGTPKPDGRWNVYGELRNLLAARGVPAERVAFIHDAGNDKAKADLFTACRDGRVNVLIGSTEKMGVGTNVQARAVAWHDLDCPWRPADLDQRGGRVPRQGNQNDEVENVRYVSEGSFDVYRWQTVERKATFIHQIMRGDVGAREIDDIGDQALSYAEVKALATGNPLIMERAGVAAEVAKLTRRRAAHHTDQARLVRTRDRSRQRAALFRRTAAACDQALATRVDTRGDRFSATVAGRTYSSRPEAAASLRDAALDAARGLRRGDRSVTTLAVIGGVSIDLSASKDVFGTYVEFGLTGVAVDPVRMGLDELRETTTGLLTKLENRVNSLDRTREDLLARADDEEREARQADERIGRPFEYEDRLTALARRLEEIDAELTPDDEPVLAVPADQPGAAQAVVAVPGADIDVGL
ncbi:MAG: helicase [Actinobacteria bacterium]|nr:helicase [Actinomycetota bacterium]